MSGGRKQIAGWLVSAAVTLVLLEVVGAILVHGGWYPARPPTYRAPRAQTPFLVDIDPHFGAWHRPNATREHARACFWTTYRSNAHGAVDVPRALRSESPRVVALGDSFVVGHGVLQRRRLTDRLEDATGVPHLNFGTGGTGPLQHLLRYEHLARDFDHDVVLFAILPDNDFTDDDPPRDTTRYLPYLEGEPPDLEVLYTLRSVEESSRHPSRFSLEVGPHEWLLSFSYAYSVGDWIVAYTKHVRAAGQRAQGYSGYFDFTSEQLARLRWVLERLRSAAGDRRVVVVVIPRLQDLTRVAAEGRNPLGDALAGIAREADLELVDLLPEFTESHRGRYEELFFACDGHWSEEGHAAAARVLAPVIRGATVDAD